MLDLTGIKTFERPELKHLVAHAARGIENALTVGQIKGQHDLLVRLNCPGCLLGDQTDGLVCLDANGYVPAANQMPGSSRLSLCQSRCSRARVYRRLGTGPKHERFSVLEPYC